MRTKVYRYKIVEGVHVGHNVVTDAYGIDFCGRDPKTAAYCLDCHEPLELCELNDKGNKSEANET